jgi:cell division protein YceG involved in septum cleavage
MNIIHITQEDQIWKENFQCGPISSVSRASIDAAINPEETDYLFFVADKNGKLYFTRTDAEHSAKIQELVDQGLWYEY